MFDGLGSTRTTTNSSQTVTATAITEGFGATIATTGSTGSPYGFAATSGYRKDGDAGLTHVGVRYTPDELWTIKVRPSSYCGD